MKSMLKTSLSGQTVKILKGRSWQWSEEIEACARKLPVRYITKDLSTQVWPRKFVDAICIQEWLFSRAAHPEPMYAVVADRSGVRRHSLLPFTARIIKDSNTRDLR
jgi:hypothetical protein